MNVVEALVLSRRLSRPADYLLLMPDGLCLPSGLTVQGTRGLAWLLLEKFSIGDPLAAGDPRGLFRAFLGGDPAGAFVIRPGAFGPPSEVFPFVDKLELPEAVRAVGSFAGRTSRNPYESFVEYNIILAFIESLKNSKVMYGGIWFAEKPSSEGRKTGGYESFVRQLAEKNELIGRIREALTPYRQYALEEIGKFRPRGPRPYLTPYATWLENLYLHFLLKNVYQRFYLVLSLMNEKDRLRFETQAAEIKASISGYRKRDPGKGG